MGRRLRIPPPVCLFRSGFETGDVAEWDAEVDGVTVAAAYAHHGDYGAQFSKNQPDESYVYEEVTGVNPLYFAAQAQVTLISDAGYSPLVLLTLGRFGYEWAYIVADYDPATYGDTDLHLLGVAWDWGGSTHTVDTGMVMALSTWYLLQMGLYRDTAAGWFKVWINGAFKGQVSGFDNHFTSYPYHCAGLMPYTGLAGSANTVLIDCCCIAANFISTDPYQ